MENTFVINYIDPSGVAKMVGIRGRDFGDAERMFYGLHNSKHKIVSMQRECVGEPITLQDFLKKKGLL